MPELPEVETIRRQLEPLICRRELVDAWSHPSAKFSDAVEAIGATILDARRRGKYLLFGLDDERELIVHLGMTGALSITTDEESIRDAHVRARWLLDDGEFFVFRDVRRFGRVRVVAQGDYETIPTLRDLGPEPLEANCTGDQLHAALNRSTRRIKTQLLSQRPVAGIGNIYADEALWEARVHPAARRISRPAAHRLRDALGHVIERALSNGGTTLRDYRTAEGQEGTNQFHLRCYGRGGEPCERCGDLLRAGTLDARTTTWCPSCQRR